MSRSDVQDRRVDNSFPAGRGFSWSGASARFYPEFADGTAHREHDPFSVRSALCIQKSLQIPAIER